MVQHQLYATMPKYVLRLAGEGASPSWYANVNPLVVVLTVNLVTQMMRKRTALTSMTVGMFIMPVSALCMASGNMLDTNSLILGMHPRSLHDGGGYRLPRAGGDVHLSSLSRVFLLASTQRRRRSLSWIQPFAFFPLLYLRIRAVRFPFKQVLPGANPVRLSRGMAGGKRERPLHLVLLRCDRLGIRRSVDRVWTSRKEAG